MNKLQSSPAARRLQTVQWRTAGGGGRVAGSTIMMHLQLISFALRSSLLNPPP